jgi:hypothetical protein
MDLVDKEDVVGFEIGQQSRQVTGFLDDGSRCFPDIYTYLIGYDNL